MPFGLKSAQATYQRCVQNCLHKQIGRNVHANLVLVLKKNGTWRMCVDYTDLNKACPANPFALPRIDQIIDAMAGCERLSFLDAYSGYHQIKVAVKDQEKTTFITPFGAFYYVSMPFGLKSAQATYQRCVQNCLHNQIGRNVRKGSSPCF